MITDVDVPKENDALCVAMQPWHPLQFLQSDSQYNRHTANKH